MENSGISWSERSPTPEFGHYLDISVILRRTEGEKFPGLCSGRRGPRFKSGQPDSRESLFWRFFGIWRGRARQRTTIEPSTRQFGLPA